MEVKSLTESIFWFLKVTDKINRQMFPNIMKIQVQLQPQRHEK